MEQRGAPEPPDAHRLIEFQKLMLNFQAVDRTSRIPGTEEHENDVEHSYILAMTAWYLSGFFPELDRDIVIRKALAHDVVEIHTVDTFSFGPEEHLATKPEREKQSLGKIAVDWPDFPDLIQTIEEYEERATPNDCFVWALDKILPIMMAIIDGGPDFKDHNITLARLEAEKRHKVAAHPIVARYYDQIIQILLDNPQLLPEDK